MASLRIGIENRHVSTTLAEQPSPVLLYDGDCGFCAGSVQFVLAREPAARRGALRFAPLQGVFGSTIRQQFPDIEGVDSVVWFEPGLGGHPRVQVKSSAALAAVAHLGGVWRVLSVLGLLVPRVIRDAVYDMVAKRRFELAAPACLLPDAATRTRFLL